MAAEAASAEAGRRRRLLALAVGSGAAAFGGATAVLGLWPGWGGAGALGAALVGLFVVGWRAEPELEWGERGAGAGADTGTDTDTASGAGADTGTDTDTDTDTDTEAASGAGAEAGTETEAGAEPWRPRLVRELESRGELFIAIAAAILEPRRGRAVAVPRIAGVTITVSTSAEAEGGERAVVEGRWSLDWAQHPVPGRGEGAFEETGTFRCEVRGDPGGGGALRVEEVRFRSDLFEGLIPRVEIPAGSFLMGSPEDDPQKFDDERPQHAAEVAAFELGATAVTEGQYAVVAGRGVEVGKRELPATRVSWLDAIDFCNALSRLAGRRPCYERLADRVVWDPGADGFRLPDEEEWEYACRAGTTTRHSFGDDASKLGEHAWFSRNSGDSAHPVGQKKPNPWGLYDMHGNVWEWVWDTWDAGAYRRKVTNDNDNSRVTSDKTQPLVSPLEGDRVVRGGSFLHGPRRLRSAYRGGYWSGDRDGSLGFRCAGGARPQLGPSSR